MSRFAQVELADGRQLDYVIRISAKARTLRLKMTARAELTVIAPKGIDERRVVELVTGKRDWITAKLNQFEEVRHLLGEPESARPEAFALPALAETWRVEYKDSKVNAVGARTDRYGRVLVFGAVSDPQSCKAALCRWLSRRARETLISKLESLANESGLRFSRVLIKNQRTRWGAARQMAHSA